MRFGFFLILFLATATAGENTAATLATVKAAAVELEKLAANEIRATGIPGLAVVVVYKDEVIFAKGFGVRESGKKDAVDADTVFQLASLSKPIASTVVASVVGNGLAAWDSRISDLDPGFEMFDPWVTREITVRDFFAHRSGLPDHAGDDLEDLGFSRAEVLRRLRYQPPNSSFRSAYAYTNFGLTEAAVAVARATGKSWEDLSEEQLYKPLGMSSTSSRYEDFLNQPNHASGHVLVDGRWMPKYQRDPDAQSPAGGVSSSVNDLAKWMRLQLAGGLFKGRQVVAADALSETHHPQILTGFNPNGLPAFYGLGWNVGYDPQGRLRLSHSGAFSLGASTAVFLVPAEQLGVAVLTNATPLGVAEELAALFLDHALYGKPTADWLKIYKDAFAKMQAAEAAEIADYSHPPTSPAPAAPLASYVGTYANSFFGEASVVETDGSLTLLLGPQKTPHALIHWSRDTFVYQTASESSAGQAGVFFSVGPGGMATSLAVENLNTLGEGTFQRTVSLKD